MWKKPFLALLVRISYHLHLCFLWQATFSSFPSEMDVNGRQAWSWGDVFECRTSFSGHLWDDCGWKCSVEAWVNPELFLLMYRTRMCSSGLTRSIIRETSPSSGSLGRLYYLYHPYFSTHGASFISSGCHRLGTSEINQQIRLMHFCDWKLGKSRIL